MSIEAMKQALEALELHAKQYPHMQKGYTVDANSALRTAIAEAEKQEPVAWMIEWNGVPTGNLFRDEGHATREMQRLNMLHPQDRRRLVPLHTTPPAATAQRQPLTDEQINELAHTMVKGDKSVNWLARAIEAAHGITGEKT